MRTLVAVLLAGMSVGAMADETVRLGRAGNEIAFVWRDHAAYKEAMTLLRAGATDMALPLLACMPKRGTRAVIVDRGAFSHTVVVIDGADKGCRGFVTVEDTKG